MHMYTVYGGSGGLVNKETKVLLVIQHKHKI